MSDEYIKLNRESLYNEIWERSVSGVAKKYNLPYDKLRNLCKEMNIPIPKSGYWTKLEFGKPVTKTPLPEFTTNEIDFTKFESRTSKKSSEEVTFSDNNMSTLTISTSSETTREDVNKKPIIIKETHKFLSADEYEKLLKAASSIEISPKNKRLHKKIMNYKNVVKEWNKNDSKAEFSQRKYGHYSNTPPFLAGVISKESLPRVYKFLDALYRKVEELGGSVNDSLSLKIRNEHIVLRISEAQDKVAHKITKSEAKELLIYEDERKYRIWAIKPKIRKWDYIFNGKISIRVNGKNIRDTDDIKIEDRLGDILIKLYEESEVVRKERIAAEEAKWKAEEEARLREEHRVKYNEEIDKTVALLNMAEDYDKACKIRAYVAGLERNCEDDELIEWAKKKADWFDPTVRRVDEVLGEREHEEKEELKMRKKRSYEW
jgi:hypothetical protein